MENKVVAEVLAFAIGLLNHWVLESGEPAAGEGADSVGQHLNPYF